MKNPITLFVISTLLVSSCIKDDFIDDFTEPELTILNVLDTIAIDTDFQFESRYLNNVGQEEQVDVIWSSFDSEVIAITADGLATGIAAGEATLSVQTSGLLEELSASIMVNVGTTTVEVETVSITGQIVTTTFYELTGSFELTETEKGLLLEIGNDYRASSSLPGLYVYLSNNRNSISNAFEISKVTTFSGAHSYEIPDLSLTDYNFIVYYCKPFNVKVGEAVLN